MTRCFGEGQRNPLTRPTAYEWYQELRLATQQIVSCHINGQHWYSKHLSSCPWCERMSQGIPDPFPLQAPPTIPLALRPTAQPTPPLGYPTSPYPIPPITPNYNYAHTSQVQQQILASSSSYTSSSRTPNTGLVFIEILLSIFGIFGIGWCLAGRWTLGIVLIMCSVLIYWPLVVIPFLNGGGSCIIAFVIAAIIFNGEQLYKEITKRP